ncbi:hypothetical protein DM01DRAFT_134731 [Hesseltinella vesiculosa]|uniref:FHA domain-containing protein n=1 Tax=Hesseltinella vesiculosa TaxID=101127 RepID=A0A1X2GCD2_9FUNG|nr:hypothetical protein DM01DRAFT_134731 [Hesseltinella vesiculosa]
MWFLYRIDGNNQPAERFLLRPAKEYTVGRKNCDINCDSKAMTRLHAKIKVQAVTEPHQVSDLDHRPSVLVKDEKSKFGTRVNGQLLDGRYALEGMHIADCDQILFGKSALFRLVWEPMILLRQNMKSDEKKKLFHAACRIGAKLTQSVTAPFTHAFMMDQRLTLTMLHCLASTKPIVSPAWLNTVVNTPDAEFKLPSPFDYPPGVHESFHGPYGDPDCAPNPNRKKLFHGRHFFVFEPAQYTRLEPLITACRGNVRLLDIETTDPTKERMGSVQSIVIQPNSITDSKRLLAIGAVLSAFDRRFVFEKEVYWAIAYVSTQEYCNGRFDVIPNMSTSGPDETSLPSLQMTMGTVPSLGERQESFDSPRPSSSTTAASTSPGLRPPGPSTSDGSPAAASSCSPNVSVGSRVPKASTSSDLSPASPAAAQSTLSFLAATPAVTVPRVALSSSALSATAAAMRAPAPAPTPNTQSSSAQEFDLDDIFDNLLGDDTSSLPAPSARVPDDTSVRPSSHPTDSQNNTDKALPSHTTVTSTSLLEDSTGKMHQCQTATTTAASSASLSIQAPPRPISPGHDVDDLIDDTPQSPAPAPSPVDKGKRRAEPSSVDEDIPNDTSSSRPSGRRHRLPSAQAEPRPPTDEPPAKKKRVVKRKKGQIDMSDDDHDAEQRRKPFTLPELENENTELLPGKSYMVVQFVDVPIRTRPANWSSHTQHVPVAETGTVVNFKRFKKASHPVAIDPLNFIDMSEVDSQMERESRSSRSSKCPAKQCQGQLIFLLAFALGGHAVVPQRNRDDFDDIRIQTSHLRHRMRL